MAKFKVGDIVEKDVPGDTWTGRVVSVTSGNKGVRAVTIKGDGSEGPTWAFDESEIRFANSAPLSSANAVVQNAINARRARNAMVKIDDAEGAKRWDALWVKAAELKREAEALDKYLVSKKQYGYSAKLESLAKALTGF